MKIKELMSHPAVTCLSSDSLDIPARLMWEYDCGSVPVLATCQPRTHAAATHHDDAALVAATH